MSHQSYKQGILYGVPPLVFVLGLVWGWQAAMPDVSPLDEHETDERLSPRQRAEVGPMPGNRRVVDVFEERVTRANSPPPASKQYDAKGMEEAIAKSQWTGSCLTDSSNMDYARGWGQTAPVEMFAWLQTKNWRRYKEAHYLFDEWAKLSPEQAMSASLNLPDPALRAQALMTSLTHVARTNPLLAREKLQENLSLYRPGQFKSVYYDYGVGEHVTDMIASLPPSQNRTHLLALMINHMNHSAASADYWDGLPAAEKRALVDAGLGVTHTTQTTEEVRFEGLDELLRQRVEQTGDPEAAMGLISNHGREWAARDLVGSQDWVNRHMKGANRADALGSLWGHAAYADLENTVALWRQLPEGNFKDEMSRAIVAGAWHRDDEAEELLGIE